MRFDDRIRLLGRGRTLSALSRNVTLDVGQAGRLLDPYSPVTYANIYRLQVWLRAGIGETYGTLLDASGTAPPPWVLSGTPTRALAIHAEIDSVAGGTGLGQATYKWRENESAAYTTGVLTAAGPTALGTTGLSVAQGNGPYSIDNKWDLTIAQWNDQSGSGNHATASSTFRQPRASVTNGPTFDGQPSLASGDCLEFVSTLSAPNGASFFASVTNTGAVDNRILFQTRELLYYSTVSANNVWQVQTGGTLVTSGVALTATRAIVEAVNRAPNDITLGINGVLVTKTNGSSYNPSVNAGVSSPNIVQQYCGSIREIAYFAKPLPADLATLVRQGMAQRTGVTLP